MGSSIAKNTAFMTVASIGQKLIAFVYFTLVARYIGAEGTGKYYTALAFTAVFVVFVDLGFSNVLIREAAKLKDTINQYLSTVLAVKLLFGVVTYLVAVVVINLLGYSLEIKQLVYLSAVTMLFDSFHMTLYGVLRAIGDLKWEAIGVMATQGLTLILGTFFLYTNRPLIFLILAFNIASFLNFVYAVFVLKFKYQIALRPRFDKQTFIYLGKITVPFALAAIFARIYSYADSLILSKLAGDTAVGWYSVAYKLSSAFQFIPLALIAVLYPRFSEYFAHNKDKLAYLFQVGLKYLLIIAFPVAAGIGTLSQDIIFGFYGEGYIQSIVPLIILMGGMVFSFASFPIGAFLNACNRQVLQTKIVAVAMLSNVFLNLILIPRYGLEGAAVSSLLGSLVLTTLGYLQIPKVVKISHTYVFRTILQLFFSTSVMVFVVLLVNLQPYFIISILAGAVVYPAMLFFTGAITRSQLQEAINLIKK